MVGQLETNTVNIKSEMLTLIYVEIDVPIAFINE